MQTRQRHLPLLTCALRRPLVAALAAAASCAAWADDPSPYYIGARETLTHDSNAYKTPTARSDNYSSTGLLGGFDQRIGRQRLYGAANVEYNKYQNQTALDNTSYGVNAGLDWATIGKLSGNVNASANQNLATIGGNEFQPSNTRNIAKSDRIGAGVRWGDDAALSVDGNYSHSRIRFTALESLRSQSSSDSASLGTHYRLGPDLRVGAALRGTRTETPYAVATTAFPTGPADYTGNTTTGRNLDLLVTYRVSAQTGVDARLSWTRQTNSAVGGLDFSGLTGSLAANYAPTAKLAFSAALSRDAGNQLSTFNYNVSSQGGGFFGPITSIRGVGEERRTTDSLALGATYEATAKINAKAGLAYRKAKILTTVNSQGSVSSVDGNETYRTASLGADWAISRNWQLGCLLSHETRDVSGALGFSYSANIASCSAQFTLR